MTTAQLRTKAYEAAENCDFAKAAKLYREALSVYPTSQRGELAIRDKAEIANNAKSCQHSADRWNQ